MFNKKALSDERALLLVFDEFWSFISESHEVALPFSEVTHEAEILFPESFMTFSEEKHIEKMEEVDN